MTDSDKNCPHCGTHIDEHPASRCLRGWVATSVMGWRVINGKDGLPTHVITDTGEHFYLLLDLGPMWFPDLDIAASWEVVMYLTRQNYVFSLTLGTFHEALFRIFLHLLKDKGEGRSSFREDNEGCLAICRAAIKASPKSGSIP